MGQARIVPPSGNGITKYILEGGSEVVENDDGTPAQWPGDDE